MPRETNSLINDLMPNTTTAPTVGMGATRLCCTDRYPYTIFTIGVRSRYYDPTF